MKIHLLLTFTAGILALTGCSTTATKVDTGPIHARTFSYVNTGTKPAPNYADNRQFIHTLIQGAITKNLTGRGLSQVPAGGNITVAYLVITGNNASTAGIDDYFGYGGDATALHKKAHDAYTDSRNPNYFEAGTLVIDIIDSKSFKLLKRGHATRPILANLSNDERAARLQGVADEILQNLQIEP